MKSHLVRWAGLKIPNCRANVSSEGAVYFIATGATRGYNVEVLPCRLQKCDEIFPLIRHISTHDQQETTIFLNARPNH